MGRTSVEGIVTDWLCVGAKEVGWAEKETSDCGRIRGGKENSLPGSSRIEDELGDREIIQGQLMPTGTLVDGCWRGKAGEIVGKR